MDSDERNVNEGAIASNETDSTSDSDDAEETDLSAVLDNIADLEKTLKENPFSYDSHVALVHARAVVGNVGKLRSSYQRMSETFPLTEELWLKWIHIECDHVEGKEDVDFILDLFDRATKDYVSVRVWLEYTKFVAEMMEHLGEQEDALVCVRKVFEDALTSVGLHVMQGSLIWDSYREFEMMILSSLQEMVADSEETSAAISKELEKQKQRVTSIFRRQLAVPLDGLEETQVSFEEWTMAPVPAVVRQAMENAIAERDKCMKYEEALQEAESPRLGAYWEYIAFEKDRDQPARIQCIFERAIQDNCLSADLWQDYGNYVDTKLKTPSVCLSVHRRAIRNCPWVSVLWQARLQAMERHREPHEAISEVFEQALAVGFAGADDYIQLWKAYCNYLRRRIDWSDSDSQAEKVDLLRQTLQRGQDHLQQYELDPTCILHRYQARLEATCLKNMDKARQLWETVMKRGQGKVADSWLEYANLERYCGDTAHCRKVLFQAVQCASDDPAKACSALLDFESEEGTLFTWDAAKQRCTAQLARVAERLVQAEEKDAQQAGARQEERRAARSERRMQKKMERRQGQEAKKPAEQPSRKRRAETMFVSDGSGHVSEHTPPSKKRDVKPAGDDFVFQVPDLPGPTPVDKMDVEPVAKDKDDQEEIDDIDVDKMAFHQMAHKKANVPSLTKHDFDPANKSRTVFVSNLLYAVTEEKLREEFEKLGKVTDVRLVRKSHASKKNCYAYVEFSDEIPVKAALAKDRELLLGRPMFISPCVGKDEQAPSAFKYTTGLNKRTLYVSNVPYSATSEQIETIFSQHGKVKEVRMVTNRQGTFRGYCYVEMCDESSASAAVIHLDQHVLKGKSISVALSNPPGRKARSNFGQGQVPSEGSVVPTSRGRSRTQVALLPRALRQGQPAVTKDQSSSKADEAKTASSSSSSEAGHSGKALSNADFRSMLLSGK